MKRHALLAFPFILGILLVNVSCNSTSLSARASVGVPAVENEETFGKTRTNGPLLRVQETTVKVAPTQ